MNNLSWMLYLAGVSGNVQGVLVFACVLLGIASFGITVAYFFTLDYPNDDPHPQLARSMKYLWPLLAGIALLCSIIPSEKTFYLIAASEMGENALQTTTGKKAIAAVDRYLDAIGVEDLKQKK
jgi:hypothetical protein